jgi:hypothetical protein
MQDYYHTVKTFKQDQFDVIVDWTYEHCSVRDCFDETEEQFLEMERRQDAHLDTHYIARVRVFYDGHEMGSSSLGSCYAYDCDPEDDINDGISGYLEDMIYEAMDDARGEAVKMLDRLKADFLS